MVAEEAAHPACEVTLALPRFGNEHGDGVANVATAPQQQLDGGVELPGVGVLGIEHGTQQIFGAEADVLGTEAATGDHAQLVAAHGVDLAVVTQVPEGLGSLPRRGGVRREAAVEDRQRRAEVVVGEIGIEGGEPVAQDERLVRHGDEREAGEVVAHARLAAGCLRPPPGAIGAPFGVDVVDVSGALQDPVPERRLVDPRRRAEVRLVDRDGTPSRQLDALGGAGVGDGRLRDAHAVVVGDVEERGHDAQAIGVEGSTELLAADASEERAWDRDQEAGAVAGDAVGGDGLTVADARQPGQGEVDDLAARAAGCVRDEADATGIELRALARMLPRRAIEVGQPRDSSLPGRCCRFGDPTGATTLSRNSSR